MKTGLSLTQLASELERQRDSKRDFIADTRKVQMSSDAKSLVIADQPMPIQQFAERQLGTKLEIPAGFYDRMRDRHPDVLANVVNELFKREPAQHMIRTLDGNVRAVLSNGYRPIDNYDFAEVVIPELISSGAQVESCQVTEQKLYIKAVLPWLDRELPVPEGLVMGVGHNFFVRKIIGAITFSNSEVGAGKLTINPGILERACTNLAVFKDEGFGRVHVGKKQQAVDVVEEYISDSTRKLDDAALWARVRDMIKATMDGRVIDKIVAKMNQARKDLIIGDPAEVIEVFSKRHQLNDGERGGLLKLLVASGEMTRYGLQWAVTRLAGEAEDYDRASDLERLGGQVIELQKSDWRALNGIKAKHGEVVEAEFAEAA